MDFTQALIIAVIEGLTEFLPISSTAHMIFTSSFMGIQKDEFVKMFQVSIQFGAILAVVALYWRRFFDFRRLSFYVKLACAVVPALVLGYLFDDAIEDVLEKPLPIAVVMIVGGIVLLFVDHWFRNPRIDDEKDIPVGKAVVIGVWQCLAMMPGTSRAAASIIGGMQQKLSRKAAAEFSFFLAVPTMLAVTCYSIFLKDWNKLTPGKMAWKIAATKLSVPGAENIGVKQTGLDMLTSNKHNLLLFGVGNVVAFIVAALAIRLFIGILKQYGFRVWGWYRIVVGLVMAALILGKVM